MTQTTRIAYQMFAQTIVLLMLYIAMMLLGAVKFLGNDPLAISLPYSQVSTFANMLLNLALLTGLLAGGLYVVSNNRIPHQVASEPLLRYTFWLWTVLLIAAFVAGALGLLEGRNRLELPPVLDIVTLIGVVLFIYNIARSVTEWTAIPLVWTLGMGLSAVCIVIGLIPASDYMQDRVFRVLAVNFNLNVAYVLAAVALGFWLMRRFSNITSDWADTGLYSVAGLLVLAGVLVSASSFLTLGAGDFAVTLGNIGVIAVPLAYVIFASHSYYALSNRNPTVTLAGNWYALAVLLFLLGVGGLGAMQSASGIHQWTVGTRLTDLQTNLTSFAIVAVILGLVNQAVAEMRGFNQRITGLMPFWLVAFGVLGGGVGLGGAGLVQVYLERILSVGYLETQTLLIPLYALWIVGGLAVAVGIAIYALGFWARRPTTNP